MCEMYFPSDEYFLTNVKTIDDVTEDHCRRLLSVTRWRNNLISSFKTYPALNIIHDLPKEQSTGRPCAGCEKTKVHYFFLIFFFYFLPITLIFQKNKRIFSVSKVESWVQLTSISFLLIFRLVFTGFHENHSLRAAIQCHHLGRLPA